MLGTSETGSFLSGCEAISLLDFVQYSLRCSSEEEFSGLFLRLHGLIPFDYATAVLGQRQGGQVITASHVNISFSEDWFREYMTRDYMQKSAVIRENFTSYRLQYWGEAWQKLRQPEDIIELCHDFNMRDGYTCGSPPLDGGRNGSMFCFASSTMTGDRRTETILNIAAPHLHLAFARISANTPSDTPGVSLTDREKEVLDWLKLGRRTWDISVILGISERTVNFHVSNIMTKLGVTSRPQAVAVAARLGLIHID